jgi:YidC/Oxa1 family membrane protein insertase
MKFVLTLILAAFVVFCGGLIVQSVLSVSDSSTVNRPEPCILLQQKTAADEPQAAPNAPTGDQPRLEASDYADFSATGGPTKRLTLGSEDPNTGFKFKLELISKAAAIEKAILSEFDNRAYDNPEPLMLLAPVRTQYGQDVFSMANTAFVLEAWQRQFSLDRLSWQTFDTETQADGSQTARFEVTINDPSKSPLLKLSKIYKVSPASYLVRTELVVENLNDSPQEVRFNLTGPVGISREAVRSDMRKVVGGFATGDEQISASQQAIQGSFFRRGKGLKDATQQYREAQLTGDPKQIKEAKDALRIGKDLEDKQNANFLWSGITNKYFTAVLVPEPDGQDEYCDWVADKTARFYNPDGDERAGSGDETIGLHVNVAAATLAATGQPESSKTYRFQLYLGPKDRTLFRDNELYSSLGFIHTIDFLPCCCCPGSIIRPLAFGILTLMKWMYGFIGNYGVVIIILVFLVRLALHPLSKKSQVSMSKMSKLAPKAEEIRKKYAKNKTEMNKQLMGLYREQGATPIMGMLPMFVQMPIWIALYSAIYASIELRGAPFLPFWITDLSAPDALIRFQAITLPFFGKLDSLNLLPILMGVAFYLQQKLMPSQAAASSNPQMAQQQKMMMIMLPLLFPLMLYKAPSGLNLYIMSSVFAGVIEQYVIRKHIREKEQAEAQGLVSATSKTGGKTKKKKPKPFYRF